MANKKSMVNGRIGNYDTARFRNYDRGSETTHGGSETMCPHSSETTTTRFGNYAQAVRKLRPRFGNYASARIGGRSGDPKYGEVYLTV